MTPDDETSSWQKRLDRLADERQREATAATLLAALLPILAVQPRETPPEEGSRMAVKWADALRAALRGGE